MKLWLDDIRPAPEGFLWAKNVREAQALIQGGEITHISLDHDLGENELTGYNFVTWIETRLILENWNYPIPTFAIHSANPVGRQNMQRAIENMQRYI